MKKIISLDNGNFNIITADTGGRNTHYVRFVPKGLKAESLYKKGILTAPTWQEITILIDEILECESKNKFPIKSEQMDQIIKVFEKHGMKYGQI